MIVSAESAVMFLIVITIKYVMVQETFAIMIHQIVVPTEIAGFEITTAPDIAYIQILLVFILSLLYLKYTHIIAGYQFSSSE